MKTKVPAGHNELAGLQEFKIKSLAFRQILDFGRYLVRIDPDAGRGWFQSELKVGNTTGTLHFAGKQLVSVSEELPPQVAIALERAGYWGKGINTATFTGMLTACTSSFGHP